MKSRIIVNIEAEIDGAKDNLVVPLKCALDIWKTEVLVWNKRDKVRYRIKYEEGI